MIPQPESRILQQILVMCTGNICRSPMAWGLLRADPVCARLGITIESMGIRAETGSPPVAQAVEVLAERGIDIRMHRARQATDPALRKAELILVMEKWQQGWIRARWPELTGRVFLLGHWGGYEIADPYGSKPETFRKTLVEIERGTRDWLTRIVSAKEPQAGQGDGSPVS